MVDEAEERLVPPSSKLGDVSREEVGETLLSMLDEPWKLCPLEDDLNEKSSNMSRVRYTP